MPAPESHDIGPTPAPEADESPVAPPVRRVLASDRPPEVAVSRSIGMLASDDALRYGAQIACATTFAARRAVVAELARASHDIPVERGPLGGPMPARTRADLRAPVMVRVVIVDPDLDPSGRPKAT